MNEDELTFTMRLDASDLRTVMTAHEASGHGRGGGGDFQLFAANGPPGGGRGGKTDPSFMSIFKPIAALTAIEKLLGGLLRNSNIANTYMGAMGKMFGAAIDLLLIPFIPLFNLIMVGISKLIGWLISSGVLEALQKIMEQVAKNIESVVSWVARVVGAIASLRFEQLPGLFAEAVKGVMGAIFSDPLATIATGVTAVAGFFALRGALGGIPVFVTNMAGGMLAGGGGGGKGGGGGWLSFAAKTIGVVAAANLGDWLGGKLAGGGPGPERYGPDLGPLNVFKPFKIDSKDPIGFGIGKALGLGGGDSSGPVNSGTVNSGNTVSITQYISAAEDAKQVADEAVRELRRSLGTYMALRGS